MMINRINKWEIRMCDLGDIKDKGVEAKTRPCLIMSCVESSDTAIVIPITSKQTHKYMRTHVSVGREIGLLKESQILCEQITTISKIRIGKKVAEVTNDELKKTINRAMMFTMGIDINMVAV